MIWCWCVCKQQRGRHRDGALAAGSDTSSHLISNQRLAHNCADGCAWLMCADYVFVLLTVFFVFSKQYGRFVFFLSRCVQTGNLEWQVTAEQHLETQNMNVTQAHWKLSVLCYSLWMTFGSPNLQCNSSILVWSCWFCWMYIVTACLCIVFFFFFFIVLFWNLI